MQFFTWKTGKQVLLLEYKLPTGTSLVRSQILCVGLKQNPHGFWRTQLGYRDLPEGGWHFVRGKRLRKTILNNWYDYVLERFCIENRKEKRIVTKWLHYTALSWSIFVRSVMLVSWALIKAFSIHLNFSEPAYLPVDLTCSDLFENTWCFSISLIAMFNTELSILWLPRY